MLGRSTHCIERSKYGAHVHPNPLRVLLAGSRQTGIAGGVTPWSRTGGFAFHRVLVLCRIGVVCDDREPSIAGCALWRGRAGYTGAPPAGADLASSRRVSPLDSVVQVLRSIICIALSAASANRGSLTYVFPFGTAVPLQVASAAGFFELMLVTVVSILSVWRTRWEGWED